MQLTPSQQSSQTLMTRIVARNPDLGKVLLTIAVTGILGASRIHAQSAQARPEFEAASIEAKLGVSPGSYIRVLPGKLDSENQPLRNLIMRAYDVRDFQISGGPGWIDSERYDIEAKAEGNATRERTLLMLQTLLEDRFHLAHHRDTKELPVYELTVAKSGFKLQPLKEGSCVTPDPNAALAPGQKQSDFCGYLGMGKGSLDATALSMASLATALSYVLGRPVADKTGVMGEFSIHLTFAPQEIAPEGTPLPDTPGTSIFSAIQEQLGLKLNSSKGPVEILVIDRVEKPSEN
jgi:uncharacterized protein (TIGR03435 family)